MVENELDKIISETIEKKINEELEKRNAEYINQIDHIKQDAEAKVATVFNDNLRAIIHDEVVKTLVDMINEYRFGTLTTQQA